MLDVLSADDWRAIFLTIKLASVTTILLLLISMPIAWWLARTRSPLKPAVEAIVAMPLVLPPTVLGFYLLILLGPQGYVGAVWQAISGAPLTFTFTALVIASMLYSLPFVVQPMHTAFEYVGARPAEVARTLGASRWDAFVTITLPLASRGILTASVLGFAHTVGEFGVVLMVGGNIPGQTQVLSIVIYDHVEALNYPAAHVLASGLVGFSFAVLLAVFVVNRRFARNASDGRN